MSNQPSVGVIWPCSKQTSPAQGSCLQRGLEPCFRLHPCTAHTTTHPLAMMGEMRVHSKLPFAASSAKGQPRHQTATASPRATMENPCPNPPVSSTQRSSYVTGALSEPPKTRTLLPTDTEAWPPLAPGHTPSICTGTSQNIPSLIKPIIHNMASLHRGDLPTEVRRGLPPRPTLGSSHLPIFQTR